VLNVDATIANLNAGGRISGEFVPNYGYPASNYDLTVTGTFNWTGTEFGAGPLILPAGAHMIISGTAEKLLLGTVNNSGTITWKGPGRIRNNTYFANTVVRNVSSGSVFNVAADGDVFDAYIRFSSIGTIRKTAGSGVTFLRGIGTPESAGIVAAQTGTLELSSFTFSNTTRFIGPRMIRLRSGSFTGGSSISVETPIELANSAFGAASAGGTTLTGAGFTRLIGSSSGTTYSGLCKIARGHRLFISGPDLKSGGTFVNDGTVTWQGGGRFGDANFQNLPGGTFNFSADGEFSNVYSSFTNAGTLRKIAGTGITVLKHRLNNSGMVDLRTGTLQTNGFTQTAGSTTLLGGSLSSSTSVDGGSFTLAGGNVTGAMTFNGGVLNGSGTITGNVINYASIRPGASNGAGNGIINITGTYTQKGSGVLALTISSATPGTGYDQLRASSTTTLSGALTWSLINGLLPTTEQPLHVLTYSSRSGSYDTTSNTLSVEYTATGMSLRYNPMAPRINSISPTTGLPGSRITIAGSNLTGGALKLGTTSCIVDRDASTPTRLIATVPTSISSGLKAVNVTTTSGSTVAPVQYRVIANVSGTVRNGTTPIANVPIFLVKREALDAFGAVAVNPTLFSSASGVMKKVVANAEGAYLFTDVPSGSYRIIPSLPGTFFTESYSDASVGSYQITGRNFVVAGTDEVAPTANISSATTSSASGTAGDATAGVLAVVVTLRNSSGAYLDWSSVGNTTLVFGPAGLTSYRIMGATTTGGPVFNKLQVTSQSWAQAVSSKLALGTYQLEVQAIDRAFIPSAVASATITKGASASTTAVADSSYTLSSVPLSSTSASAEWDSITLTFAGTLDVMSATDTSSYQVTIDGHDVLVESAGYNQTKGVVMLGLQEGELQPGQKVQINYQLRDVRGAVLSGQVVVTAR
jgi:hypothetical protein